MKRGRVLIEYDHTFNIFLHVKEEESSLLPPTQACRTSSGPYSSGFAQIDLQTAADLFTSHPPSFSFLKNF